MKKAILPFFGVLLLMHFAAADIHITEIMHSPLIPHSDGEWVELYNSGNTAVNLSNYTIDGNPFDDITIQPNEYIVIARELLDGDDEDLDSFESYWGNNNGVWDEPYNASDGSFSLSAQDTIILTNGIYTEQVTYNESGLNGNSLQRTSLTEWEDALPTPGNGTFEIQNNNGDVEINLIVENSQPEIHEIIFQTDDSEEQGTQILPNLNSKKQVTLTLNYTDLENDVNHFSIEVNNQQYNFTNNSLTFEMQHYDLAKNYSVNITICDNNYCDSLTSSFEYLGIISTTLDTTALDFNLNVNQQQETMLQVTNTGNVVVDVELSGTDLVSNDYNISIENLEVYNDNWFALNTNPLLDLDILPNTDQNLLLRLTVPSSSQPGAYTGVITVTSMESD